MKQIAVLDLKSIFSLVTFILEERKTYLYVSAPANVSGYVYIFHTNPHNCIDLD